MSLVKPELQAPLSWTSHRLLELQNGDVAVLADHSTGWSVLKKTAYEAISTYLSLRDRSLSDTTETWHQALTSLWDAGLLLASGKPHPHTIIKQAQYPNALLIKLTGACNFACTYCYDYDTNRFKANLSLERVYETLSFLLDKQDQLSIVFHGGEPLLRFDLIRQIVQFVKQQAEPHKHVGFSIQTNASRLNDEVVAFFETNNFSVGISLDGMTEEGNALRPVNHGLSALEHIHSVLTRYGDFVRERCGFLAVASRTNVKELPSFALWLQDQGISGLSLSFLDLTGRGTSLYDQVLSPEEAVALFREFVALIRNCKLKQLAFKSLIGRINNLFTFQPRDLCHKGRCGAAGDFLVLDAEGSLRTCDCIYHPFFELGDKSSWIPDNFSHPARAAIGKRHDHLREHGSRCSRCALFGLCGGTCVAKAIAKTSDPHSIDPIECALSLYIYPELLQEFATGGELPLFDYYQRHRMHVQDYAMDS